MKIELHKGEHRGGVPHQGAYYVGSGGASKHLVYCSQYEPYKCTPYDLKWDNDRAGDFVWFDSREDAVSYARALHRSWGDVEAVPLEDNPQLVETLSYRTNEWIKVWRDYLKEHGRMVVEK